MNLERLWDILLRKTDFGRTTEVERSIAANCHSTFVWPFLLFCSTSYLALPLSKVVIEVLVSNGR